MAIKKPTKPRGSSARDAAVKASPEFQNFEAALKHIIQIPKAEVDRLMAERPKRARSKPEPGAQDTS